MASTPSALFDPTVAAANQAKTAAEISTQTLLTAILQTLNRGGDLNTLIAETLHLIRDATGFDAVGLRLRQGEDYPYFEQNGFSEEFLRKENFLCSQAGDGSILRDAEGRAVLECTCGLVLSGRTDPGMSCFTEGGSFWTNASSELLALPPEADPRSNPRNRCIHSGYESVGLFPVTAGTAIIGLVQLNDRRVGRFTPELIAFYESLAHNVGLALQRTAAEKAVEQSERRFRAMIEKIGESITVVDATGKITFNISGGQSALGYSAEEMLGRDSFDLVHPNDLPRLIGLFRDTIAQPGKIEQTEVRVRARDGSWRWQFAVGTNLLDEPAVGGILINSRDITERKQAEEALRQLNENLEQRVAERTALAEARARQLQALAMELIEAEERERRRVADLLHDDLQQCLAAARIQLQGACEDLHPKTDMLANVEKILGETLQKTRRLSHELSPAVLHHSGLVASLEWLARQMQEQFGLHVRLESDGAQPSESAPLKVFLFRAVQELLFNVVKHAGVKIAQVELSSSEGRLSVSVSDQGHGFDPGILDSIIALSGFGLLSLRERAHYIGGSLTIESVPGKGSRFTLTVPIGLAKAGETEKRAADRQSSAPAECALASGAGGIRVLFVDDHHVMRQGLIRLMTGQPAVQVVGEAANGREAIEKVRELEPDLVVMDVSMPEMDGIEATRRIKAKWPEVRVIGLSMYEDEQLARSMQAAGAEAFMTKTASLTELLKAIYGTGRHEQADRLSNVR